MEQFREGIKSDTSRLAHLKDEEMKDRDIELLKEQMRPSLAERDELKRETSPSLR